MKITAKLQKRYDQISDGLNKEVQILKADITANEQSIAEKNAAITECVEKGGASTEYVKLRREIEDSKLTIEGDTARLNHLENSVRIDGDEVDGYKQELQEEAEDLYQKARTQIMKHLSDIEKIASDTSAEIKEANNIMKKVCVDLYRDSAPNEYETKLSKREKHIDAFLYHLRFFPERLEK